MAGDGMIDGKFTIKRGQGISQAIRDELGLTQEQCNKLGKSVWTQIFAQVEAQNKKGKIYDGGSNGFAGGNNFVVHPDQVIEFSKEIWGNIVKLVNDKLGTNIAAAQTPAQPAESGAESKGTPVTPGAAETPVTPPTPETPKAENAEETPEVPAENNSKEEGKRIAQELNELLPKNSALMTGDITSKIRNLLESINSENIIYVLEEMPDIAQRIDNVDALGFGFDKTEVYKYILTPLLEKAKASGIDLPVSEKDSFDQMKQDIKTLENFIKANALLEEVVNMNPKPEIESGHNDEGNYDLKKARLSDGRLIAVRYDENGEIRDILISHDTTPDHEADGSTFDGAEVVYMESEALYNTDHSNDLAEGSISPGGYDFEKFKALAEKIFGKNN